MTANQLAFQKNAIAEAELAEKRRANRASEDIRYGELGVARDSLNQKEREALAKYGTVKYASPNEERGGLRDVFRSIPDIIGEMISPLSVIFKGGK